MPSPETDIVAAYQAGNTAGLNGVSFISNPYNTDQSQLGRQLYNAWILGWNNGTKDAVNAGLYAGTYPRTQAAVAVIPNASVLQLFTVPFIVVPALPGLKIIPLEWTVEKLSASPFTIGAATKLDLRQNNGAGTLMGSTVGITTWAAFAAYGRVWCGGPGSGGPTPRYPALDLDSSAPDVPTGVPIVAVVAGGNLSVGTSDIRVTTLYRAF